MQIIIIINTILVIGFFEISNSIAVGINHTILIGTLSAVIIIHGNSSVIIAVNKPITYITNLPKHCIVCFSFFIINHILYGIDFINFRI